MKKQIVKKGPIKPTPVNRGSALKKEENNEKYFKLFGVILIILLGTIIYSNSFKCSFQFDDFWIIVNNTSIYNLSDVNAWMSFFPTRPVSIFSFALNYHFNQLHAEYYHFVNLIIHLINACLAWWLTLLIFSSPAIKENKLVRHKQTIALLVALLFVSHPLATQAVTYITQRMASMAAMFYLLSLALYMHARIRGKGKTSRYILFAASFLSALLAVFSKENAYTLPFAILLCEWFFIRTTKLTVNFKDYRLYLVFAGFCALFVILYLKFSFSIFKAIPPDLGRPYTVTPLNYLFTEFSVIVKYIQLLFLPLNQNLDYDFPVSNSFFQIRTLFSFLLLLSLFITGIFLYKKNRILSFGIFWFFLTLSVESGIIPLNDYIDEYRTYLPSFGFLLTVCCALFLLLREKYKYLLFALLTLIIGSNSILAYNMNKIWNNDLTLWKDVVAKSPAKARPYNNLGYAYDQRGQIDSAISNYSKAIEINPDFIDALFSRGIAFGKQGQWDKAIADLTRAVAIEPNNANAFSHRGIAYGNLKEWDKALADFSRVIAIDTGVALTYFNRGFAYTNLEHWEQAITDYSKAVTMGYNDKKVFVYRGMAYASLMQWDKAIADYTKALEIDPVYQLAVEQREIARGKQSIVIKQ